jgi:hypothetical protein
MRRRREEPEECSRILEIRRRLWEEGGNDPQKVLEIGLARLRALGIKPREAKPAKPAKRRRPAS